MMYNVHTDLESQLQVKTVETFKYLRSTLANDLELAAEVTHRVQRWTPRDSIWSIVCDTK